MLRLNPVKSKLVSAVPLGNLVLFSTHNSWWAGLRVNPGRQLSVHHGALILFGFHDGKAIPTALLAQRRRPIVFRP